jgi:hypothetical protein
VSIWDRTNIHVASTRAVLSLSLSDALWAEIKLTIHIPRFYYQPAVAINCSLCEPIVFEIEETRDSGVSFVIISPVLILPFGGGW